MRLITIISAILAVLLIVDGAYMVATKYNGGETQALKLPDGWIVIISAGILVVVSFIAFVLSTRSQPSAAAPTSTETTALAVQSEAEPEVQA